MPKILIWISFDENVSIHLVVCIYKEKDVKSYEAYRRRHTDMQHVRAYARATNY